MSKRSSSAHEFGPTTTHPVGPPARRIPGAAPRLAGAALTLTVALLTVVTHAVALAATGTRALAGSRGARRREAERGDVPGWVLITLMTAGLVTTIWALAGTQLAALFTQAISSVTGPGRR